MIITITFDSFVRSSVSIIINIGLAVARGLGQTSPATCVILPAGVPWSGTDKTQERLKRISALVI